MPTKHARDDEQRRKPIPMMAGSDDRERFIATAMLLGGVPVVFGPIVPKSRLDVHAALAKGLSAKALIHLVRNSSLDTPVMVAAAGTSMRTFQRFTEKAKARLDVELSSRTWKLAEIMTKAMQVMGDMKSASDWMMHPALGLDGKRPIELLGTETGRELVEEYLGRIEHGVYT
jgi:putative toxin-antitoxin system antitoxin component (TIGR02293 family)